MRAAILIIFYWVMGASAPAALAQSNFETEATYAAILDFETGELLYSKGADTPMAPSSMSKLMTALMVFEALERGELSLWLLDHVFGSEFPGQRVGSVTRHHCAVGQ